MAEVVKANLRQKIAFLRLLPSITSFMCLLSPHALEEHVPGPLKVARVRQPADFRGEDESLVVIRLPCRRSFAGLSLTVRFEHAHRAGR
ncbi:hypothetical protein DES52_1214 [Deinococcus yavapaiensis KR-236]|uniref:Uncharacterized protein n=1 Tax=Deinococcus yavapaiensis KR-236 TaxID=694435 RepID=A0A318RZY5_9DEIO|nr:hypothetical protein DES52_1214 [Deinococcus yavapaiensis KR-236]